MIDVVDKSFQNHNLTEFFIFFQHVVSFTRDQTESSVDTRRHSERIRGKPLWSKLDSWPKSWAAVELCFQKG